MPLRPYSPSPVRDIPPHLVGSSLVAGRAPALYSQVAASRAPSPPMRGVFSVTVPVVRSTGEPGDDRLISSPVDTVIRSALPTNITAPGGSLTSSDEHVLPQDPEESTWTTVRCRRARSLGSLERIRSNKFTRNERPAEELTRDQVQVVDTAASHLTRSQKKTIRRRRDKLVTRQGSSDYTQEEGPSRLKGKSIDPGNWGNVNISQESLDVEAQAVALKSLEERKLNPTINRDATSQRRPEKPHKARGQGHRSPFPHLPAESHPVAQIARDSYLGRALRDVGRSSTSFDRGKSQHPERSPHPSSDPWSSDDGDPQSSPSEGELSSSSIEHRRRHNN